MNTAEYVNGWNHGKAYAARYGVLALARFATAGGYMLLNGSLDYTRGALDAALAITQSGPHAGAEGIK